MSKELILKAREAANYAYAPYSNFHVGAAILTKSGNIYIGCNIETFNAEGLTCAERNAVANMVSAGEVSAGSEVIDKIAVTCQIKKPVALRDISPCGACRQVITEFSDKNTIIIIDDEDKYPKFSTEELLPLGFNLSPEFKSNKVIINKNQSLENIAKQIAEHSYVPMSKNKIGCAIQSKSGNIYYGAAVDNSSTGLYISAERSAIANAIINGETQNNNPKFIDKITIYQENNQKKYQISQNLTSEFL